MNKMKDFQDLYLKVDVLLLHCVRNESTNPFELDLVYYLSTLRHSQDAMLRFIDVNLKLISDIEKYYTEVVY